MARHVSPRKARPLVREPDRRRDRREDTGVPAKRTTRKEKPAPTAGSNRLFLLVLYLAFGLGAALFLGLVYAVLAG